MCISLLLLFVLRVMKRTKLCTSLGEDSVFSSYVLVQPRERFVYNMSKVRIYEAKPSLHEPYECYIQTSLQAKQEHTKKKPNPLLMMYIILFSPLDEVQKIRREYGTVELVSFEYAICTNFNFSFHSILFHMIFI